MSSIFSASLRPGSQVGRFVLRDVVGRGAQAVVWRAHDPRLDREVALKLLLPGAPAVAVNQWLHEARAVSRITHPNIVPVFEADEADGRPYLVFELVRGRTLAEALRQGGAMPPRAAVALLRGVVDALCAAHALGIVHRDLKPSNILLDPDGRARVMDFGIAARMADSDAGRICGTPGYISPEAARGAAPTPAMDVFAAGLILGELLTGRAMQRERDPKLALRRVLREDLALPDQPSIDEALRNIVHRAVARDPAQRFDSAAALLKALDACSGASENEGGNNAKAGSGTLDFLLRRMRHRSDFPALSDAVSRIQRVANSDSENLNSLAGEILKDVALTNKLLRLVNSVQFSHAGGGTISTVSRAIALVGFAGVRNMALSLVLLERMQDKQHAALLKEQFLTSLMAGQLASELSVRSRDSEESYLGAMMQNLGRLVTEFYLPEEARAIREELRPHAAQTQPVTTNKEQAATRILGIGFQELGIGVARAWGLPESLQHCMRVPDGDPPGRGIEAGNERMRWLARACNEVADTVLTSDAKLLATRLEGLESRYASVLGLRSSDLTRAVEASRRKLGELAMAINLELSGESPARRLIEQPEIAATLPIDMLIPTVVDPDTGVAPVVATELLSAGIQDITNSLSEESFRLNEILRMILETMLRALAFQRVVFCLKDPKTMTLTGRFGLGDRVESLARLFSIPLRNEPNGQVNLFAAVCDKGVDTLIADATAANIVSRLPDWYRQQVDAKSFLLLPMMMKRSPFALIYADKAQPGSIVLDERELSLLRTLRNQALMAFRQAG